MLSDTSKYALRAVLYLAERGAEAPVRVEDIADGLAVPRNYLSKILHVLGREGVLTSLRGPHGGFSLAVPASGLSLADVVAPFEPQAGGGRHCLLGREECSDVRPCAVHDRWQAVGEAARAFFEETTVADLVRNDHALEIAPGRE